LKERDEFNTAFWQLRSAKVAGACLTVLGIFGSVALLRLAADLFGALTIPEILFVVAVALPIVLGGLIYNAVEEVSSLLNICHYRLSQRSEGAIPPSPERS
jgi:hypothetical protein